MQTRHRSHRDAHHLFAVEAICSSRSICAIAQWYLQNITSHTRLVRQALHSHSIRAACAPCQHCTIPATILLQPMLLGTCSAWQKSPTMHCKPHSRQTRLKAGQAPSQQQRKWTHSMAVRLQTQGMTVLLETQLVYTRIYQCCNKSKVLNLCSGLKWLK